MKSLKWLIVFVILLLQSGCWSKIEVNEQIFVLAIYVDKGEKPGTVEVTISSPLPNRMMAGQQAGSAAANGKPYAMITRSDITIPDTMRTIQKDLTRRLNFGHTREIMVGQDFANDGIGDLLDWIEKEPNFHISSFLTTAEGKAKDVAELTPLYEQMPAEVLRKMNLQHNFFSTKVKECLIARYSQVGFATNLMSIGFTPIPSEGKTEKWAGIKGAALYQGDKLTGTLPSQEARAIAWNAGRLGRQAYTVTWDGGESRASVLFDNFKFTKSVRMTKQGPRFMIHLKTSGNMIYKKDSKQRKDTEVSHIVTNLLNSKIESELNSALRMTKKSGSDVLKLGLLLEWKYPRYWKRVHENWPEYYRTSNHVQIKANVDVINITNQP
ncbi:hypothetical protein J23TS9_18590 [Paenibacillus sp. J23TS9]|uniref:Ger(x)C family spore germination protein n=1 Tax=Paenibacillus sp. J23TS9 TaxID=2807193 RepID=UPI001B17548D|nr:Ger(x)C family spore germination protein [Paenibacillus sp. J23TS9]GIP26729.1 hypothetical protein J23TS9_18590 [Paenibacillus sp. J23TS9]